MEPMNTIGVDTEKWLILQCLEEAPDIKLSFDIATRGILKTALEWSQVIYISAHANEQYLAFEQGDKDFGRVNRVWLEDLEGLISKNKKACKLVVLLACDCEEAGKVFIKAGIPHVVCIRNGCDVKESVVQAFTEYFVGKACKLCLMMVAVGYGHCQSQT